MLPPLDLLWTALAGLAVGFLSGVFGLGGGFLIVPVLHVFLGIPIRLAVGAAACQVLGPSTTSLLARRTEASHFRLPLVVAGGQAVGTVIGATVLHRAGNFGPDGLVELFGYTVPLVDIVVLSFYLLVLAGIGLFALWESRVGRMKPSDEGSWLMRLRFPPYCEFSDCGNGTVSIPLLAWFGTVIGFVSGLLGISGGLLLLPGLIYLWGMPTQLAIRNSLVMVWIGAIPATITHAMHGNVDLRLVMALLIGGTIGAQLGTEFGQRASGIHLRRQFGWLLLATAAIVACRLVSLFA